MDHRNVVHPVLLGDDTPDQPFRLGRVAYEQSELKLGNLREGGRQADRVGARSDLLAGELSEVVSHLEATGYEQANRVGRYRSVDRLLKPLHLGLEMGMPFGE